MTRHALHALGISLSEAGKEHGAIAVELAHEPDTYMIFVAAPGPNDDEGMYRVTTAGQSYMGFFEPGARFIQVRKLEPTELGVSSNRLTEKNPVFVEDMRYVLTDTDILIGENAQSQMRQNPSRGARQHQADFVRPIVEHNSFSCKIKVCVILLTACVVGGVVHRDRNSKSRFINQKSIAPNTLPHAEVLCHRHTRRNNC